MKLKIFKTILCSLCFVGYFCTAQYINGNRVNVRSQPNTKSKVITQVNQGEYVSVLDSHRAGGGNEAILNQSVEFYNQYGNYTFSLNRGKAVRVEGDLGDKYRISYHNGSYRSYATVYKGAVDFLAGEYWVKIRTNSGRVGWILNRYIN